MRQTIPDELFNQIPVPESGTDLVPLLAYVGEMAYKLPTVTDVMMAKEIWHVVCDVCERIGAMLFRETEGVSSPFTPHPPIGRLQRYVGAGTAEGPVELSCLAVSQGALVFSDGAAPAYVDYSVVPDVNADPDAQKAPRWFLHRYEQLLLAGALSRLQSMTGKGWSDPQLAQSNGLAYVRDLNRASVGLITSGMRKEVMTDMRFVYSNVLANSQK